MRDWMRRIGWFVLIWIAGVALLGVVAYGIRSVIFAG